MMYGGGHSVQEELTNDDLIEEAPLKQWSHDVWGGTLYKKN